MSSINNPDINNISTQEKYHIFLLYVREKDGSCGGGYHDPLMKFHGGVGGKSFDEMLEEAYESLEECMEGEPVIPFDMKNLKESVVFDLVECQDIDEMDMITDLAFAGKTFDELKKTLSDFRSNNIIKNSDQGQENIKSELE